MKKLPNSNWDKIKQDASNNEPIPYDDDDRAMGFHNPNNDEEVEKFFASATNKLNSNIINNKINKRSVSLKYQKTKAETKSTVQWFGDNH